MFRGPGFGFKDLTGILSYETGLCKGCLGCVFVGGWGLVGGLNDFYSGLSTSYWWLRPSTLPGGYSSARVLL